MKRFLTIKFYLRIILLTFIVFVLLGGVALYSLNYFVPHKMVRSSLEKSSTRYLERNLTIEETEWSLFPPSILGHHVRLYENDGQELAYSPKVRIYISLKDLLQKKIKIAETVFINPTFILRRRENGEMDLLRMIRHIRHKHKERRKTFKYLKSPVDFYRFTIKEGRCRFYDDKLKDNTLHTSLLVDATGFIDGKPGERFFPFLFKAIIDHPDESGSLTIKGSLGSQFDVHITSNKMPIQMMADHFPILNKWKGRLSLTSHITLVNKEYYWNVSGHLINPKPKMGIPFPDISGEFLLSPKSTSTASLVLKDGETQGNLKVRMSPFEERKLYISFESPQSDINRLREHIFNLKPLFAGKAIEIPKVSTDTSIVDLSPKEIKQEGGIREDIWEIDTDLVIQNAVFREETFNQLSVKIHRGRDGSMSIQNLHATAFGGDLKADALLYYLPFEDDDILRENFSLPPRFRLEWHLLNMDVQRFKQAFKLKKLFSGHGESHALISGKTQELDWTSFDAEMTFKLTDGVVWGLPGLLKTLSRMNLISLIQGGGKDQHGGMPFQKATAHLLLKDGVVTVPNPALFENKTLQVAFLGGVDLQKQEIDAKLVFNFLTFVGEVVKAIPVAKTVLMGKKKSIFPMVFRVRGGLQDPDFDYQAAQSLLAPFRNVFTLPASLFRKSKGEEKKNIGKDSSKDN